ncbi:hypothetical protein BDN70DRAFT_870968 [Pholiota conissans]|uniref:Uncharacterized protein n=1 Tax=Pholiota conissans TaxID=109636 RepID=A0A9P6CYU8_9AGAR|nr:hypothetical protein BDN70DRAFT_870968 [Pholiota conissans]
MRILLLPFLVIAWFTSIALAYPVHPRSIADLARYETALSKTFHILLFASTPVLKLKVSKLVHRMLNTNYDMPFRRLNTSYNSHSVQSGTA